MSIIREIEVTRKGLARPIDVTYGTNMLQIEFVVTDFILPEGATSRAFAMDGNKNVKSQPCTVSGNKISFEPKVGLFEEGKNILQLAVNYNGKNLFTFYQPVTCHYTMQFEGAKELENDPTFAGMVMQMQQELAEISETIPDKATLENNVIKFFKSGETDKELFSVDLSTISGAGGLDLENLTLSVSQVGEYQRLSMSDGTTTKTVDIPVAIITDEQAKTYIQEWLNDHPEAITTIADKSINPNKTTWLRQIFHNIFDASTITDGYYFFSNSNANTTGGGTANYFVSDYIPVEGGKEYYFNAGMSTRWFDSDKVFITDSAVILSTKGKVTAPENASYVRFSANKGNITADLAQVYEYIGEVWDYDTYRNLYDIRISSDSYTVALVELVKQEIENGNVDIGELISLENIPFSKMNGFEEWHWNIVNPNEVVMGSIWSSDGSDRELTDSDTTHYRRTEYISVISGEKLYGISGTWYGYDSEKIFVSVLSNTGGVMNIPDGVAYIRATATGSNTIPILNMYRRGYSQGTLTYQSDIPYSTHFPMFKNEIAKNGFKAYLGIYPWADIGFAFIGDSFTAPSIWNRNMVANLKGEYIGSEAVSGGAFSDYDGVPKTAYEQAQNFVANGWNPDVILITLGTNDANNKITLGEIVTSTSITDFDLTTYTGGMQACLNYLQNNFPNAIIYIGWTPMGGLSNANSSYIERMKEIALMYGIEYIETRTCGVTTLSEVYADCYEAGVNGGHPTTNGQYKIAEYMTRLMSGKK